ncbi:hypothetical protein BpHYR1_023133 [Brachionus plicatilis]|uniref:Uncharacterized protein n=1 Tax=Brachionus plicatilis TaxID=10195 RepID=A0A3M7QH20_BRAPC|nr:hypothetical protein BpHYR1_023133 [Brachionus plicatilis]
MHNWPRLNDRPTPEQPDSFSFLSLMNTSICDPTQQTERALCGIINNAEFGIYNKKKQKTLEVSNNDNTNNMQILANYRSSSRPATFFFDLQIS